MIAGPAEVGAAVERALEGLRERLVSQYGWTLVEVEVSLDPHARVVTVQGAVLVDRIVDAVAEVANAALPCGWRLHRDDLRVIEGGTWRRLEPGVHRLYARHDGRTTGWGAWIEMTERDRVVQHLAGDDELCLVRGRDGTVGWIRGGLGEPTAPLVLSAPADRGPGPFVDSARTMLKAPYRLGGATSAGIDCSALVQFALGSLRIVVPRHSSDQLQIDPHEGPGPGSSGDLEFAWNEREALCHVGLATSSSILHASRSRGQVVEDPTEVFDRGARRRMHVPFASLVEFAHSVAGSPSISAAGFALGRAVSDQRGD